MTQLDDIILPATLIMVTIDTKYESLNEKQFSFGNLAIRGLMYGSLFGTIYNLFDNGLRCSSMSERRMAGMIVGVGIIGYCIHQFSHLSKHKNFVFPSIPLPSVRIEYNN